MESALGDLDEEPRNLGLFLVPVAAFISVKLLAPLLFRKEPIILTD